MCHLALDNWYLSFYKLIEPIQHKKGLPHEDVVVLGEVGTFAEAMSSENSL